MRAKFALAAFLQTLALSAPADLGVCKVPVTCTKPDAPMIAWFKPSIPDLTDCTEAIKKIGHDNLYATNSEVSFKTCSISYTSPDDLTGSEFADSAKAAVVAVLNTCKSHQGTYTADGPEITLKKPSVKDE